jgi:hypothetical protein
MWDNRPVHTYHDQNGKKPNTKRFGFAGLCFGVAFICWAIQKGDAALNPDLSWSFGLFWYAIATALCVAGVWLWDRSADRYIAIRGAATVIVIGLAYWVFHGPVIQQYRKEHAGKEAAKVMPAPGGPPRPVAVSASTAPPRKPKAHLTEIEAKKETVSAQPVPQVYGTQHNEPGATGYQANGPNARIDVHPTIPARALITAMSETDILALRDALAVSSGKPIDISLDGSNADDVLAFSNALVKAIAQAHITIGSFYGNEIGGGIVNADGVVYPCKHPGITFQFGHDRNGDYSILSTKLKDLAIIDTINSCGSSDPEQLKVFIAQLN